MVWVGDPDEMELGSGAGISRKLHCRVTYIIKQVEVNKEKETRRVQDPALKNDVSPAGTISGDLLNFRENQPLSFSSEPPAFGAEKKN